MVNEVLTVIRYLSGVGDWRRRFVTGCYFARYFYNLRFLRYSKIIPSVPPQGHKVINMPIFDIS